MPRRHSRRLSVGKAGKADTHPWEVISAASSDVLDSGPARMSVIISGPSVRHCSSSRLRPLKPRKHRHPAANTNSSYDAHIRGQTNARVHHTVTTPRHATVRSHNSTHTRARTHAQHSKDRRQHVPNVSHNGGALGGDFLPPLVLPRLRDLLLEHRRHDVGVHRRACVSCKPHAPSEQ